MFCHPPWAVGSYSRGPPAASMIGTKSTEGFYRPKLSPCNSSYRFEVSDLWHAELLPALLLARAVSAVGERRVGGRRRGREAVAVVAPAASAVVVEVLVAAVVERLLELSEAEVALVSPSRIMLDH